MHTLQSRIEEDYDVPKCDIPGEPTCTHKPHTPHSHPPSAYDQRIAPHPTPHPTSHHHDVATPEPPSIDTIPRSRTAHQRRLSYDSLRSAEPSSSSANLKTQSLSSSSLISADTADRVNHRVMADLSMTSRTLSDKQVYIHSITFNIAYTSIICIRIGYIYIYIQEFNYVFT